MKKTVSLALVALLFSLAGCNGNKDSNTTTAGGETTTSNVTTANTATSSVNSSTSEGSGEETTTSGSEEEEEATEIQDSSAAEIFDKIKSFADSESYSMSFELEGKKYRDVVTNRYIYHDKQKSGIILLDSFDPSSTNNYDKILYSFTVNDDDTVSLDAPYMYDAGYAKYYLNDFRMEYTMHSLKNTLSSLKEDSLTDEDTVAPGKWVVNKTTAGYQLFSYFSNIMGGYTQVLNYEFHLYSDGSLHVDLLHYKVDENGAVVSDENGNKIVESIATFIFSEVDTAKDVRVESRFPDDKSVESYVPKEFKILENKPLTFNSTLSLVDKTGVEKTTIAAKSSVIITKDAEEYIDMDGEGNVTGMNLYANEDGYAVRKYLGGDNTVISQKLTSNKKDVLWADAASDFSFLATDKALVKDPNNPKKYDYLNVRNASSIGGMMTTFSMAYGLYGDVSKLSFYLDDNGAFASCKFTLSDGGMGNMKSQFHYEIEINFVASGAVDELKPLAGDDEISAKFDKALARFDGTKNVSYTKNSARKGGTPSKESETLLSVAGEDKLDSLVRINYSSDKISNISGYKKDGDDGYIPFKKINNKTGVRATSENVKDYSFKDALGINISSKVFVKNDDGTYSINKAVDADMLYNNLPFDNISSAGDTLKIKLNEAGDAIKEVDFSYSGWGSYDYVYNFAYDDDVTLDSDYQDAINALTPFVTPTTWKAYADWSTGLTTSSNYYSDTMIKYFRFDNDHIYNGTDADARRTIEEAAAKVEDIPFVWYDALDGNTSNYVYMGTSGYSTFDDVKDGVEGKGKRFALYLSFPGTTDQKKAYYPVYTKALVANGYKLLSTDQEIKTSNCKASNANTKYRQYYNEEKKLLIEVYENMSNSTYVYEICDELYTFTPNA